MMIDNTAIIDPKAKIDLNVKIGPFCVIGANVEIKKNTIIQSHVSGPQGLDCQNAGQPEPTRNLLYGLIRFILIKK